MNACTKRNGGNQSSTKSSCAKRKTLVGRQQWVEEYARRILRLWLQWETQMGVACAYLEQVKADLAAFYENPLKRTFIERTY